MKIVTSEQMRQIEQECARLGLPGDVLMENAGRAVAAEIRSIRGDIREQRVLCLIGPGNNGGDGLVAARYLCGYGASVSIYLCSPRANDRNLELVRKPIITIVDASKDSDLKQFDRLLSSASGIIDALFGTGKVRPLEGVYQRVLERVAAARRRDRRLKIFAVDLPSGLNADTGAVDPATPHADYTITLGLPKAGLYTFPGRDYTGDISVAGIGIPDSAVDAAIDLDLMDAPWAESLLPARPLSANKGTFGRLLVVAGSVNYIGAAYLACCGATRVGAGLVTLATPATLQPILASKLTETTYLPLPEASPGVVSPEAVITLVSGLGRYDALLVGCGLGQDPAAVKFMTSFLAQRDLPPLVLDADALNALAGKANWSRRLKRPAILTPHPGEMARLAGTPIEQVQSDRTALARRLAREWQKVIVLKGAHTVVAAPDGPCRISPFANPGLASAGTGDVLAGAIAGLLAQGLSLFDAASLGVYLHGQAGEIVRNNLGDAGMTASDLLPALPLAIKEAKQCC